MQDSCKKNLKSCKILARRIHFLQESCKKNSILARILQEKWKNYALSCKISCKILARFWILWSLGQTFVSSCSDFRAFSSCRTTTFPFVYVKTLMRSPDFLAFTKFCAFSFRPLGVHIRTLFDYKEFYLVDLKTRIKQKFNVACYLSFQMLLLIYLKIEE